MVRFAQQFLDNVHDDIHDMITDTRTEEEGYDGLDSERDTNEEVETALRCCPENLTRRDERFQLLPIQCILLMQGNNGVIRCNAEAVSFVHFFASFAIECNLFEADQRGGLLIEDPFGYNTLSALVMGSSESHNEDNHQLVDTTCLASLIRLRQSDLFKKEDIQRYDLLQKLCREKFYFAEQRFRYLTDMDPTSLIRNNPYNGGLLLHFAAIDFISIERFRQVFDTGMRYFPHKIGFSLLFCKNIDGRTPFELACWENWRKRNEVMDAVVTTLAQYSSHSSTTPLNIRDALILTAIDENIHLNGLYFLMRRQPDTMLGMLRLHQELTPSSSAFDSAITQPSNSIGFGGGFGSTTPNA